MNPKKTICGSESEKNEFGSTTLVTAWYQLVDLTTELPHLRNLGEPNVATFLVCASDMQGFRYWYPCMLKVDSHFQIKGLNLKSFKIKNDLRKFNSATLEMDAGITLFVRILPCLVSTMNMLACFFISESFVI
jgi:hypothetical protein